MKKYFILTLITLSFIFSAFADESTARVGAKAPDFTLVSADGKTHSLSDFKGKHVILEWVNYGCPFVVKHYATNNMQKLQKEMTDKGIVWLSICSSADGKQGNYKGEELKSEIKSRNTFHTAYLIDEDGKVGKMYGAKTTPHMYIVNPEGNLVYMGAIDDKPSTDDEDVKTAKNFIKLAVDELMAGKELSNASNKSYGCSVKYK